MDAEIEYFRQQYKRQKTLEKIVNARVLNRPKTKKWQVAAEFAALPFFIAGAITAAVLLISEPHWRFIALSSFFLFLFEVYLRFCLVQAVRCYQHYADAETRRRCKCIPSCSEYAAIALKRVFPLAIALFKIRKRLLHTCNGEEYKVDFPCKKMGEKYESGM